MTTSFSLNTGITTVSRSLDPTDENVIIPKVKLFWIILLDSSLRSAATTEKELRCMKFCAKLLPTIIVSRGDPSTNYASIRHTSDWCREQRRVVMKVFVNKQDGCCTFSQSPEKLNPNKIKTQFSEKIYSWHNRDNALSFTSKRNTSPKKHEINGCQSLHDSYLEVNSSDYWVPNVSCCNYCM